MQPWSALALKLAITLWLVIVSAWDLAQRRIPNLLVLPVMGAALLLQLYEAIAARSQGLMGALVAWALIYILWRAHVFGGGDAKLLMALFAIFPTMEFLRVFPVVILAVGIPLLVYRYARQGLPKIKEEWEPQIRQRRLVPSEQDLRRRGRPYGWTLALTGVVYVWWFF